MTGSGMKDDVRRKAARHVRDAYKRVRDIYTESIRTAETREFADTLKIARDELDHWRDGVSQPLDGFDCQRAAARLQARENLPVENQDSHSAPSKIVRGSTPRRPSPNDNDVGIGHLANSGRTVRIHRASVRYCKCAVRR